MSAQIKIVPSFQTSLPEPKKLGAERRKRKRGMFTVPVQIRGGVGTLEVFEDLVTSLDVSRDGLLLATSRGGYFARQRLHVSCAYWCTPTAINMPRNAQVIRNVLLPNFTYALAPNFYLELAKKVPGAMPSSPFPNQVRVLCVESDSVAARALREILEKDGSHVVVVSNAQEALDILHGETPDVILAEAEGQEISGKDLSAMVKTCPSLQQIPVILLTELGTAIRLRHQPSNRRRGLHEHSLQVRTDPERHSPCCGAACALLGVQRALQRIFLRARVLDGLPQNILAISPSQSFAAKKRNLASFETRFRKTPSLFL